MGPYSPYKFVHHRDKIEQMKSGKLVVPLQVQIVISNRCNHCCNFCAYRLKDFTTNQLFDPKTMIATEKVIEIIDDCVDLDVKAIQYTGGGEPTVHPGCFKIFAHTLDCGLDLALVTNGTELTTDLTKLLTAATWVRVSLDAATSETYRKIRHVGPATFARTLANIERLCKEKQQTKSDVIIGIGFVVTKENYKEIVRAARLCKDLGVDNLRISAVFQPDPYYFDAIYSEIKTLVAEAKQLETPTYRVFDLFGDRVADLHQQHPNYIRCPYSELNIYIGADLNIYRCCNVAYNSLGHVGSLVTTRFKDVWESPATQVAYKKFDARNCPRCMFNNKNKFINYVLSDDPPHVNFI